MHIYARACLLFLVGSSLFWAWVCRIHQSAASTGFILASVSVELLEGIMLDEMVTAAPPLFQEQKNHLYYCIVSLDLSGDGGCRHSRAESGCVNTQQTDSSFQPVFVRGFVRLKRQKSHTGAPLSGDPVSRPRLAAGRRSTPHQSHTQQPVVCVWVVVTHFQHTQRWQ